MKIIFSILIVFCLFQSAQVLQLSHNGQYAWYTFDQGPTGSKCESNQQCDGQRTCSWAKWCQGESRPPKDANYSYDESITGNKCDFSNQNRDYYCDGNRSCTRFGWCQGQSR